MRRFTAREAARSFGAVLKAVDDPVVITLHGRPTHVLMRKQTYQALVEVSRAHFENSVLVGYGHALARFEAGDHESGIRILRQSNAWAKRVIEGKL